MEQEKSPELDVEQQFNITMDEWEEHCAKMRSIPGAGILGYLHGPSFQAIQNLLKNHTTTTLRMLQQYLAKWDNKNADTLKTDGSNRTPVPPYLLMLMIGNVIQGFSKNIKGVTFGSKVITIEPRTLQASMQQAILNILANTN